MNWRGGLMNWLGGLMNWHGGLVNWHGGSLPLTLIPGVGLLQSFSSVTSAAVDSVADYYCVFCSFVCL
jgi:hypothetical protein